MKKGILGCELTIKHIPLSQLLPRREKDKKVHRSRKYATIKKSIESTGLVEPLVVQKINSSYVILDGHWRFFALKELKKKNAECYITTSEESFSYNYYVNRLSTFQEHAMIKKAIDKGVSEETIATALNIKIQRVKAKIRLTKGLHPEVVRILGNAKISVNSVTCLKAVSHERQIEMANLMVSANDFSLPYAKALLDATSEIHLLKKVTKVANRDLDRLRLEHQKLEKQFQAAEERYSETVFNLTLSISYLRKMLDSSKVVSYLSKHHHEIFLEFESLVNKNSI